jgi:hypothetical protein
MTAMPDRASLSKIMDEVEALEKRVAEAIAAEFDFSVYTYRWRPRGVPDFPCIYNWLAPSPADPRRCGAGARHLQHQRQLRRAVV